MLKNISKVIFAGCVSVFVAAPAFTSTEYIGSVTPLNVSTRAAGTDTAYPGVLHKVQRTGTICYPYITKINDDVIVEPGQPLYQYDMPWWNAYMKQARDQYVNTVVQLVLAKVELIRFKKLAKDLAQSEETYETYLSKYATALGNYEYAKAQIPFNYEALREAICRPTFEGIVTKIYQSSGTQVGQPILDFTQLNPIGINVKMDRAEARKLAGKPVKIYPVNTDKPQGIIYGRTMLTDDGVQFVTENYPHFVVDNPGLKIKVVRQCMPVINFNMREIEEVVLSVPAVAIGNDANGAYVWKAVDQQVLDPEKGISNTFTIQKIYVTPGDLFRRSSGYSSYQSLKDGGSLKLNDLVVYDSSLELQDGEKVFFPANRYILMPGDQVKVVVGK